MPDHPHAGSGQAATSAARTPRSCRTYLVKGGFLWVDDFWGSYAWQVWENEIRKVLPRRTTRSSTSHATTRSSTPCSTSRACRRFPASGPSSPARTSERGADSAEVHARAIADQQGRVMVFMTHNTDVSDSWEREGEDPQYFRQFSVDGYRVAVNVLLYAMTH